MKLHLETLDGRTRFRPGEAVAGVAAWESPAGETPGRVEVRLRWETSGKGDRDWEIAAMQPLEPSGPADAQGYRLTLPSGPPYSFSGRLISVAWRVELSVTVGREEYTEAVGVTVSPTGEELRL